MKVVILAGGYGTRLSDYTEAIPKPMVSIGNRPILWHIMSIYARFGFKDFYLALGYKAEVVKEYFLHYRGFNSDFTIDLSNGEITTFQHNAADWKVTLVDTGQETMTGGRVKRLQPFIGNETFMLTYGDGLADIDICALVKFHRSHGKMVSVTSVHPGARFGELAIVNDKVVSFKEKPQTGQGWINGGFFVIEPGFFELIADDRTVLEATPLEKAAQMGELMAFCHDGFWQCMDTKRDRDLLEAMWSSQKAPWFR